jgi:hypothetical protein
MVELGWFEPITTLIVILSPMDIEFVVEDDLPTVLGKLMQDQPEETAKVLLNSLLILLV